MRAALLGLSSLACGLASGVEDSGEVLRGTEGFLFDPRLEGIFETIDPAVAGWESEVYQDAAMAQLHALGDLLDTRGQA